jgi:hypothetical protein
MRRRLRFLTAGLVVSTALTACGDDTPVTTLRRGNATPEPAAAGSSAPAIKNEFEGLDIPEKLKHVDWKSKDDLDRDLRDTRDPFQIHLDDIRPKTEGPAAGAQENPCNGELCDDEASGLQLIGIITGTAVHKAMMVDARGVGHMVRAGDVVGRSPYRITRITRNEVVLKPLQPPLAGQAAPQEIVKRLVSQEELQELLP